MFENNLSVFKKALWMLTPREKRSGLLIIGLIVLKGIGDTIGVATVMPFLSILGNPELVDTNPIANYIFNLFGFESVSTFIFFSGVAFVILLFSVSILRSITTYTLNRWVYMREYSISHRLLSNYMRQPYEFFLNRHTGDLNTYILNESIQVVASAYKPAAEITNAMMTFVMIIAFLIWAEPATTFVAVSVLGGCYFLLYFSLKVLIGRMGQEVLETNKERFRIAGEALNGVKPIKLAGRESTYTKRFAIAAARQAQLRAISNTLRQVPKFGLEALAFSGIIVLSLVLVARNDGVESGELADVLPVLGLYAFAGYRILPTMQIMYTSFSSLRFGGASIEAVYKDLNLTSRATDLPGGRVLPLEISQGVGFRDVAYLYPGSDKGSISDMTFEIARGQTIGIVGSTGAGKTTLVDVFLGLLPTSDGGIFIDGELLTPERVRNWQASVGYVPQDVFLVDASIKENIALGTPPDEIDDFAVRKAAASAQLIDFIEAQMTDGFDTYIGERGVRISGGQRQRIGIARALYRNPEIIVFDEATSALDNATEREIMKEIRALSGYKTIVMIAHRLSTVKSCDFILVLDKGRLVGQGTYDELLEKNKFFQILSP